MPQREQENLYLLHTLAVRFNGGDTSLLRGSALSHCVHSDLEDLGMTLAHNLTHAEKGRTQHKAHSSKTCKNTVCIVGCSHNGCIQDYLSFLKPLLPLIHMYHIVWLQKETLSSERSAQKCWGQTTWTLNPYSSTKTTWRKHLNPHQLHFWMLRV